MNFPFYIAKRYLFSKKSTNVINLISAISVVGVAIATMALVVTLSVFNGFHDLVATLFTSFDPQLQVVPTQGKTVPADDPILTEIRQLPEIDVVTETVEDQALAIYKGRQAMVKVKGVDDNFSELTHINEILYGDGQFALHAANLQYGTVGIRLAQTLGMPADWERTHGCVGSAGVTGGVPKRHCDLLRPRESCYPRHVVRRDRRTEEHSRHQKSGLRIVQALPSA